MIKRLFLLALMVVLSLGNIALAQDPDNYPPDDKTVVIDSTNLPIVWIDVDGATIDREERISARMKIIHNGKGQLNYGDTVAHPGQHIDYEGYIALRYRGNSSYSVSDKKPYSFRTLSKPLEQGYDKKKVPILGMGKDNNWALLAPYSDKSMIRDLLAFEVARPWMDYTPQGRLCEVYLDGIYYGVYILCEVVSKGKYRLNLDDPGMEGDELTGGYIMEVGIDDEMTYVSKYHPVDADGVITYTDRIIQFQYKSPDYEDMTSDQIRYINEAIDRMEDAFASPDFKDPEIGYRKYVDVQSFMDYQIVNELGHNVDAYRMSAKFYKQRDSIDPRFKMVIWDFNLAFGNCRHNQGSATSNWVSRMNANFYQTGDPMIPFWWQRFISDNDYVLQRRARWAQMRQANLRDDRLWATIDSLANEVTCCGAEARNAQAWPRWGVWVWPNYYVSTSYDDEIRYIKDWLVKRIKWLDGMFRYTPPEPPPTYEQGDVDGDGQVSIADVNVIVDILLGGVYDKEVRKRADVDNDQEVTVSDVTYLIQLLLDK